jgi:hypothetical protein
MRLSDAGMRRRQTKQIYLDHQLPPWLTEGAVPRSLQPIVVRHDQCAPMAQSTLVPA